MVDDASADHGVGRLRVPLVGAGLVLAVLAGVSVVVWALDDGQPPSGPVAGSSGAPTEDVEDAPGTSVRPVGDEELADALDPDAEWALGFAPTGIAGGGFQNVVSFAPDGSSVVVGGDVSGLHRSTDGGRTWLPVGQGLPRWAEKVAAVAHHPEQPGLVVAAGGFAGDSGGILRSTDGGASWTVVDETLHFSGQHAPEQDAVPTGHPRGTGQLLVWIDDVLFAATFDDGLHRSTDRGATWQPVGFDEQYLRGLALHPDGRLLVATHGDGVWVVEDPAGTARARRIRGAPAVAEEVAVGPDGTVLVAAGRDGLWSGTTDGAWRRVVQHQTTFSTVAVGGGRWFAGSHEPDRVDDVREPGVLRATAVGGPWEHVATGSSLDLTVLGSGGQRWWVAQAQDRILPDGGDWTAGQFAVDPTDPNHVLLAGRAGVWASHDGGGTWNPSVLGLQATVHDGTAVADDGRIVVANTDHRLLVSDDHLASVVAVEPGRSKGTAVAVDRTGPPGTLLVATAERDTNSEGELFRLPAGTFEPRSLGLAEHTGGRRVMAVTSGRTADGGGVVVAAVEGAGVWRLQDGQWWQAATEAFTAGEQRTLDAGAVWLDGPGVVVLLDRTRGLYRSTDAGRSFERVLEFWTDTDRITPTGFLAADPRDPDRVLVSTFRQLLRVDGLGDATPRVTDLGIPDAGPVVATVDAGVLVVTRDDDEGRPPGLVQLCGDERREVAVGPRFLGGAVDAIDLDLDDLGHLVVTTANVGVVRSTEPVAAALPCRVTGAP